MGQGLGQLARRSGRGRTLRHCSRPRPQPQPLIDTPALDPLQAGYLPLPTDLTFTGVANSYYFDTYRWAKVEQTHITTALRRKGNGLFENGGACCHALPRRAPGLPPMPLAPGSIPTLPRVPPPPPAPCSTDRQPCTDLFCPLYSLGVAPDPLPDSANSSQFYLAVGLDSGARATGGGGDGQGGVCVCEACGAPALAGPFNAQPCSACCSRCSQASRLRSSSARG